ncbi:hypothetical protein TH25_21085 [Thalassospira profundimaris]|uniref:Shedu protein SduA C-terminal domain-containing protein n=1 Tax=Thalassospira profundimaris TaxID=502049 RepID=A0A367WQI5_9PROT|nr:Shedu immune nuclease family protein [Thalassospira profundimaris]RCK43648.1 hypothetical protein TH25_21085 [Thalassospira profundimaris]
MGLKVETETRRGGVEEIYVFDDEDEGGERPLVFRIRKRAKVVEYYPQGRFFPIDLITFEGFAQRPDELNEKGFFKTNALRSALSRKLKEGNVSELTISRSKPSNARRHKKGMRLVLSYADFQRLATQVRTMNTALQSDMRDMADGLFHDLLPRHFSRSSSSPRSRLTRLLASLDDTIIPEMSSQEIERLMDFSSRVVERRYVRADHKSRLISSAKLKIDDVALSQVIDEFEAMQAGNHNEAEWGRFLRRNLYLVESRYVHVFDRLNVITGTSREVDFGLVDTHGFLDIFEIKTPETRLLSASQDRGNYYWHSDATKAVTQAEKYLYNAEQRGLALEQDIRRELKTDAHVTRPRALLLIGHSKQLDSPEKREDFRVLRMSLKNIEIVLYDELLDRLKNQKSKGIL